MHRYTLVGDIENLSNALATKWNRDHNGSYNALFSNLHSRFKKLSRVSEDGRKYTGIGRVLLPKIPRRAGDLCLGQWVKDSVA